MSVSIFTSLVLQKNSGYLQKEIRLFSLYED